jgi:Protein of unknown function (DUF3455)
LPFIALAAIVPAGTQSAAQPIARPSVPGEIKAPATEEVVLVAHASGSQIYTCTPATDGPYAWKLKAPEAELRDSQGAMIGRHFAGPTWQLKDGSEVTGQVTAKKCRPG